MAPRSKIQNKPQSGPRKELKKPKKTSKYGFKRYLKQLLKTLEPEIVLNMTASNVMEDFFEDMLGKIASEAGQLRTKVGGKTMTSDDVLAAIKLTMPPELASETIKFSRMTVRELKASYA